MCGVFGVAVPVGQSLNLSEEQADAIGDELAYRGPDGRGRWRDQGVLIGHERLAVRDLSASGAQPRASRNARWILTYNGELYDHASLRSELLELGHRFDGHGDTEVVAAALEQWGESAVSRLRGMFAIAAFDTHTRRLLLARDPLGRKPLYWTLAGRELVFASSPAAILRHPRVSSEPDMQMVSAYLTTIRTGLGSRTLFKGVKALVPGEVIVFDLDGMKPTSSFPFPTQPVDASIDREEATDRLRRAVEDATHRHLVSDVPVCALLSGGIDSSVISVLAKGLLNDLETWCAGSSTEVEDDFLHAREMSSLLGTNHREVSVGADEFDASWNEMIRALGIPLSTPNEVAIRAIAQGVRGSGSVVALSGEGADELFAGYEAMIVAAAAYIESDNTVLHPGRFQLESTAWISPAMKPTVMNPEAWEGDDFVVDEYERTFERCAAEVGSEGSELDVHLRFLRRFNLTGLLERFDTATMLAGVEGRTPFADQEVLALADAISIDLKIDVAGARRAAQNGQTLPRGKRVLRDAFRSDLPASILERPKASFPLPFTGWLDAAASGLQDSSFARTLFQPGFLQHVTQDPAANWSHLWPMANLARWGDSHWGESRRMKLGNSL